MTEMLHMQAARPAKCLLNACFKAPALNPLDLLSGLVAVQINGCRCGHHFPCPRTAVLKGHTTHDPSPWTASSLVRPHKLLSLETIGPMTTIYVGTQVLRSA